MVFNSPAKAYRTFSSKLAKAPGKTRFDRLNSYFESVRTKERPRSEWTFEDRVDSGNFFYYPYEVGGTSSRFTCFEKSAHLLMAARELYPNSNPRMAYIDEGARGVHSVVLFEHQNELWGGDISYDFMSPVHFKGRRIVYDEGKGKIKFNSVSVATARDVDKVIENLRGPKGCEKYLSEGGQRILENPFAFRPYSIFMNYSNGKLVSDIRFTDFDLCKNTAIRRKYDLNKNLFDVDVMVYRTEDWARLTKPHKICGSDGPSKIGGSILLNQFCSVADLKKWKMDDFVKQFGSYHWTINQIARDRQASRKRTFFFMRKTRNEGFRMLNPDFQNYLSKLPQNYVQHYLDYNVFKGADQVLELLSGEVGRPVKSWKELTMRGKNVYTGSFAGALREMTKREATTHRTLDHKVLKLLKE